MAAGRLPHGALTLKQFLRRQQVLQLYRRILRALRDVPAEADRRYLQEWAREEFRRNKDATEEVRRGNKWAIPKTLPVERCVLCLATWFCSGSVTARLVRSQL
uniref:LYR motif-containing protein 2 n=1 Tax=Anas zonorhyncha TaxID=75864 RepID=A0A8B9U879_9AVES